MNFKKLFFVYFCFASTLSFCMRSIDEPIVEYVLFINKDNREFKIDIPWEGEGIDVSKEEFKNISTLKGYYPEDFEGFVGETKKNLSFGNVDSVLDAILQGVNVVAVEVSLLRHVFDSKLIVEFAEKNENCEVAKKVKKVLNAIDNSLSVYATENLEFFVFVSSKSKHEDLGTSYFLQKVLKQDLDSALKRKKRRYDIYVIDELLSIFDYNSSVKKLVHRDGHGSFSDDLRNEGCIHEDGPDPDQKNTITANLHYDEHVKFLKELKKLGCLCLSDNSCFSGGYNLVSMYQENIENKSVDLDLGYYVIIFCLTDCMVAEDCEIKENIFLIKEFFVNLRNFIKDPQRKKQLLRRACKSLNYEKVSRMAILSTPNVMSPEEKSRDFVGRFRPLNIFGKEVMIITSQSLKELTGDVLTLKDEKFLPTFSIIVDKTIRILGNNKLYMYSCVPGNAHHYIEKIEAKDKSISEILHFLGNNNLIFPAKFFFVHHLVCKLSAVVDEYDIRNFTVFKPKGMSSNTGCYDHHICIFLFKKKEDSCYRLGNQISTGFKAWCKDRTDLKFKELVKDLICKSSPKKFLLSKATVGLEYKQKFMDIVERRLSQYQINE